MASGQNGLIYVGIPRERYYIPKFVDNRDRILTSLQEAGRGCGYFQAESHRVDRNRDAIVAEFLKHPNRPEWLLMIDSDMEHPPDCGQRLARWGESAKIVGGLYFNRNPHHDPVAFTKGPVENDRYGRPTQMWEPIRDVVYKWLVQHNIPLRDGSLTIEHPNYLPTEVDAVGTGCLLIHRTVLERMDKPIFEYKDGSQSEDLEFCQTAKEVYGEKVYVDLTTVSGHYVNVALGQAQFRTIHEGRGVSLTSYTPDQAIAWVEEFLGLDPEAAHDLVSNYNTGLLRSEWVKGQRGFYKREEVGHAYVADLLHWNASAFFDLLKRRLIGVRSQNVIEFGGGIGTVAIQLALQSNNVTMIEINDCLRGFSEKRFEWTKARVVSEIGDVQFEDSIDNHDGRIYDLAVAIDVLEHLPRETIFRIVERLSKKLKIGGKLFFHNNFGQQDVYPMHYDHSKIWPVILDQTGLFQLNESWAVKVR